MLIIKNVKIVGSGDKTGLTGSLVIDSGKVISIGEVPENVDSAEVIDASGMTAAPGLVDVHAHFRDPGFTYKEDIASGAKAAARGGFTTVVLMANTKPCVDNEDTLREVLESAKKADINVLTVAAVSKGLAGREQTDMKRLKELGAVGFSDDGAPVTDAGFLRKAMLEAKVIDAVISLHEEDPSLVGTAGINYGRVSAELGIRGAPSSSESSMVARDVMLALETGARLHLQHLSCKESVEAVRFAKSLGARVTAEVTPQHLALTEDAVLLKGTLAKLNPPFRTEADRQSLLKGLKDGVIDMIATDHAPHSAEEKARPFKDAPSGVTGVETALSVGITEAVRKGYLTIEELIEKMTVNPAALYGLNAGKLAVGEAADIVIFDENESYIVKDFASKSSNSPFAGERLYGKVKYTICGGIIVYQDE